MRRDRFRATVIVLLCLLVTCWMRCPGDSSAAESFTLNLLGGQEVRLVGALRRWDQDGNPRQPVDPKARIDRPQVTATAERVSPSTWVFSDLPAGRYDLVILAEPRIRVEGFHYPPVLEFDPFLPPDGSVTESVRKTVVEKIAEARQYENKVTPLYLAGDDKQVRVLIQLLRDKPTSFDGQLGEPAATLRHEVWQFTNRYGGWSKEKRTRVLDRILMPRRQLRQWTWIWDPRLGGLEIGGERRSLTYHFPRLPSEPGVPSELGVPTQPLAEKLPGLWPY